MGKLIILNTLSIMLVACGVFLALKGIHGWGWLVFLGAANGVIFSSKKKTNNP